MTRPSGRSVRPAIGTAVLVDAGDGRGEALPDGLVVVGAAAGLDDLSDVGTLIEQVLVQRPDGGERRVVQAQAAVGAEHRDAFAEVVEGGALDADQRVVAAFQAEALGDVLVDPGHAALGMGIGDDAQRLPVGQVPPEFARLDRAIGGHEFRAPAAKIRLLGQLAAGPQAIEHGPFVGGGIEEGGVEVEQGAVGGVVRLETAIGAEDGDGGLQLVEGAGVELDLAAERRMGRLDLGDVDADAGAAVLRGDVGDVEDAPRAGDDGRQAFGEHRTGGVGGGDDLAAGGVEQFEAGGQPHRRHRGPRRRRRTRC